MLFSVLSNMFRVEQHRQRMTRALSAATPVLGELLARPEDPPGMLASNMRGTFLVTRKSSENVFRYGFTECSEEDEGVLITELARVLWDESNVRGWGVRCTGVPAAVADFRARGLTPRTLVVSAAVAKQVLGREAQEGFAGTVDNMQVLVTTLPENVTLVGLEPTKAGVCVRVGTSIGMLVRPDAFRVVRT
jgi:hypothetical protein